MEQSKLEELVMPELEAMGFECVKLEIVGSTRNPIVRLYIDKAGGVSIKDCAMVSRSLGLVLVLLTSQASAQDEIGKRRGAKIKIVWSEYRTKNYVIQHEAVIPKSTVKKVADALQEVLGQYIKVFGFISMTTKQKFSLRMLRVFFTISIYSEVLRFVMHLPGRVILI